MKAFPLLSKWDDEDLNGMTLRDYFAGQIAMGLSIRREGKTDEQDAENAYRLADAMMKVRVKDV